MQLSSLTTTVTQHARSVFSQALLLLLLLGSLSSCKENAPSPSTPTPPTGPTLETPFTTVPDEFVGTWFAKDNQSPLTTDWDQGTSRGELGFRDFRTMVFTKDGKNAMEYSTTTTDFNGETRRRFYKITGTLEYKPNVNPRTLTFHAQSGTMRVFSSKATGYQESSIAVADMQAYRTVWQNPQATSFATSTNYLTGQRLDGGIPVSAEYQKVSATTPTTPSLPTTTPPAGPSVKIGDLYYATATIGDLEWTTMNYAGPGGIKDASKPQYGTFFKAADLSSIPVPAGWRIPTKQDYVKLLQSQGVTLESWGMTPDNLPTTRALGHLMAPSGWLREDGLATNTTGFNALPANIRVLSGNPQGEGSNCILWTSDKDADNLQLAFKIIQMTSTTYASVLPFALTTVATTPHIPVRFVKNK